MTHTCLYRRRQPWALALVLAWLLFMGWGQAHRVLHLGVPTFTPAAVSAQDATTGLADEDGSSLCRLLDQLSQGAGMVAAALPVLSGAVPLAPPMARLGRTAARLRQAFEARGPPRLT